MIADGSAWVDWTSAISVLQNLSLFGIGTTADATNPFSAKLNKALWTAKYAADGGDGDLRYTLNKESASDVLSLLMQRGFSARAEIGLIGDDDLTFKTSPDGSTFNVALVADKTTGGVRFLASEVDVASASTCDIGAAAALKVRITGTTTVTSFGSVAHAIKIIRFAGALTLTHNATSLILPGGANVTTANGDTAIATSDASGNWRVRAYQKASGKAVVASTYADVGVREVLTAARTYYVRTDGSDSNNGLANTSGGAFLTIQKAIDTAAALDSSIYDVTIQLGAGTYSAATLVGKTMGGAGHVIIIGDETTPTNVVVNCTTAGGNALNSSGLSTIYEVRGIQMTASGGSSPSALFAEFAGTIFYQKVDFGTGWVGHVRVVDGGFIKCTGNYSISAGATNGHFTGSTGGTIRCQSVTITITGTPTFTNFVNATVESVFILTSITFSGATSGGKQYAISGLSIVSASGTAFPGATPGTTDGSGVMLTELNWLRAVTAAQFDKTSSASLANVTGLSFNVAAGLTYKFRAVLFTSSNVAGGVKAAIGGTATATSTIHEALVYDAAVLAAQTRATALATALGSVTAVTAALVVIEGEIVVNAAGTLTVQFAQNASNGSPSSVLVGSVFEAWRLG